MMMTICVLFFYCRINWNVIVVFEEAAQLCNGMQRVCCTWALAGKQNNHSMLLQLVC